MIPLLRSLRLPFVGAARKAAPARWRPSLLALEDRLAPAAVSAITADFNNTAIPAGDWVWFNSAAKVSGLNGGPATVWVTHQTVTFTAGSTPYSLNVPDTAVTFDPNVSSATTSFVNGKWAVSVPANSGLIGGLLSGSGNVFLAGLALPVADGLPGGIHGVTWQGDFWSSNPAVSVSWKWAAAAYRNFNGDPNALGVKAMDGLLSDRAGTPENYKSSVTGGATGNGGTNYTGSYATASSVRPATGPPPADAPSSLSGSVYNDANRNGTFDSGEAGIAGVTLTLTGTDNSGQAVSLTTTTGGDGSYSFPGLQAGSYTITETRPDGYYTGQNTVGSQGGDAGPDYIDATLGAGVNGVGNNFAEFRGAT